MLVPNEKIASYFDNATLLSHAKMHEGDFQIGQIGDVAQGNMVKMALILDAKGFVAQAYFQAYGCPFTLASCAILVEVIRNKELAELSNYDPAWIIEALDLPEQKYHCAIRAHEALGLAVRAKALCA